jgi:hypothetical protein
MATTTPNFGWAVPTSTDLVKDGAVAIETLGDSIDASLVDLKGGTTGQVLAKASATDMDFTWSTPSTAAGYADNLVLNSAMQVWQRGTTFAISNTSAYTADRWQGRVTAACTTSYSRQATGDTTNLPNIQYAVRVQRASGQTALPYLILEQSFESVNSIPFAGKTVTLSFYARAGANFSAASSQLGIQLYSGTGTDQNISGAYTGLTAVVNQTPTLTTTWQRFSYSGSVASTATELAISMLYQTVGTAGAADYFEVTGFQVEVGSSATAFHTNQPTIQAELAACQRYCWKATSDAVDKVLAVGMYFNSTVISGMLQFPVTMRTSPTATVVNSTNYWQFAVNNGTDYFNGLAVAQISQNTGLLESTSGASGTAGQAGVIKSSDVAASLILSAEL